MKKSLILASLAALALVATSAMADNICVTVEGTPDTATVKKPLPTPKKVTDKEAAKLHEKTLTAEDVQAGKSFLVICKKAPDMSDKKQK